MNIQAGVTRFCLFDLHVSLAPLRTSGLFKPEVGFLGVPAEYEKRQAQAGQIDTARFRLSPMGSGLQWSHFWKGFSTLCADEGTRERFPRFHLPIEARLRDGAITANLPAPFGSVPVRTKLLVWPYGWSTRLELTLTSPVGLPALVEASSALRQEKVFEVRAGSGAAVLSAASLSSVLRQVTTWLQSDLFTAPVADLRQISRHAIIGLSHIDSPGGPFTYGAEVHPEFPQLPTADRARLHGILVGREVLFPELNRRELKKEFLVTPLSAKGFAITDFGYGSLLVLLEAAPRTGKDAAAARCLWQNTSAMLTTTNALLAVGRAVRTEARDWVDESAAWGFRILRLLPEYYDNLMCRQVFEARRSLRNVRDFKG